MKRRRTIVYLLVLMLLGGYFFYFEVSGKEKREVREKAARKVFQATAAQIGALDIFPKDKAHVRLEKKDGWHIIEPFQGQVDEASVEGYLESLTSLETERRITDSLSDIALYGLAEPALRIRFQAEGAAQWQDLLVGAKNPTGSGYYAKLDDRPEVFLIGTGSWAVLDRGFDELRRRELFTFQPDAVSSVQLLWQGGASLLVDRKKDGSGWMSPGYADVRIKNSKVENVLEQIGWMKAAGFLQNEVKGIDAFGLDAPAVIVTLQLKDGGKVELRLGKKMDEKKDLLAAYSSELPAVAEVEGGVLKILPRSVRDMEDHSLVSFKPEGIKRIKWRVGEDGGQVEQTAGDKWGVKGADGKSGPLDDAWRVKGVLWELQDCEYDKKLPAVGGSPEKPYAVVELAAENDKSTTVAWQKLPAGEPVVTLWVNEKGIGIHAVEVKTETVARIEEKLLQLSPNK